MTELQQGRHFSWRALTSMMTTGGFLIMGFTGLMLYATPEGRLAYWVDWSMLGLTKEEWGAIHVTSSLLFLIAGFIHLWFNWGQFVAYLRKRLQTRVKLRPEAPAAGLVLAILVAGTLYGIPPFTYVLDLSSYIKASWVVDSSMEPPFGHAEEVTLETLALRTATKADAIVAAIRDGGYVVEGTSQTMRSVADANSVSPADVWLAIVKKLPEVVPSTPAETVWTPEAVDERFEGAGYGGKTVEQAATDLGLPLDEMLTRLSAAGIDTVRDARLKTVATDYKTTPTELLKLVLVAGYKLPGQ